MLSWSVRDTAVRHLVEVVCQASLMGAFCVITLAIVSRRGDRCRNVRWPGDAFQSTCTLRLK